MSLARLRTYFIDTILPRWLTLAFDQQAGQFVEALELDGSHDRSGVVRTRTAARQIYVYAHAAALGVAAEDALAKAECAFENLHRGAWISGERPGYAGAFRLATGEITNPRRDLYDHACVLLALAWLSKATGKKYYGELAARTMEAMDITLAAPFGGWAEDDAGSLPRRQNPHMHCLEACLALWETGHDSRYAARAGELFSLFKTRFYDSEMGILREFFGSGWEVSSAYGSGRLDPGHMAEWTWLISRYERLTGSNQSFFTASLMRTATGLGRSRSAPFLVDEMSVDGVPLVDRRRLWPQAELIKGYIMRAGAEGDRACLEAAEDLAAALFSAYLENAPLETWRDAFDLAGNVTAAQIPGSSLYHLWTAVAEIAPEK